MRLLLVFRRVTARCTYACLLQRVSERQSQGRGGRLKARRAEMQMEKKVEKEGDCAQTGCCTMAFCIDASSSGWSRILLIFFVLSFFIFR